MGVELNKMENAPVIEAIIDFDCDMPTKFKVADNEDAFKAAYVQDYPEVRARFTETHEIKAGSDGATAHNSHRAVDGYQFWNTDKNELVQARDQGFSFNRLRPYSRFDDYQPVIRSNWEKFVVIGKPVQLKTLRMRFVNRIEVPLNYGNFDFKDYLEICPQLPKDSNLDFAGFYHQHQAVERETGNVAIIVLSTHPPVADRLPLLFDITVASVNVTQPDDWQGIDVQLASLRRLKNSIFANTLTKRCLSLCQQP